MHRLTFRLLLAALLAAPLLAQPERASAFVSIPLVEVDNPQDCTDPNFVGCVEETFHIARFEITNAQYIEFLNAVARDGDPHELYPRDEQGEPIDPIGNLLQIIREENGPGGVGPPFSYRIERDDFAQWPVNFISWFDAARFVNWLENGQPDSDEMADATESGTYDLSLFAPTRNPDAKWVLPTLDEWSKAAYHDPVDPEANLVGFIDYWTFPVQADEILCEDPFGSGPTSANCALFDPDFIFAVGSYSMAPSHYGTFDQAGNISEWTEELIEFGPDAPFPLGGFRLGGSFRTTETQIANGERIAFTGMEPNNFTDAESRATAAWGFRVAFVPEPPVALLRTAALATLAVPAAVARLRRSRAGRT